MVTFIWSIGCDRSCGKVIVINYNIDHTQLTFISGVLYLHFYPLTEHEIGSVTGPAYVNTGISRSHLYG